MCHYQAIVLSFVFVFLFLTSRQKISYHILIKWGGKRKKSTLNSIKGKIWWCMLMGKDKGKWYSTGLFRFLIELGEESVHLGIFKCSCSRNNPPPPPSKETILSRQVSSDQFHVRNRLFLFLNNIPFIWMGHSVFIHSPVEGYLGCFYYLAIVNKAVVNICAQIFMQR